MPRKTARAPAKFDAQTFDKLSLPEKIEYLRKFIDALNESLKHPREQDAPGQDGGKKKSGR